MDSNECRNFPRLGESINLDYCRNGDIAHKLVKSNREFLAGKNEKKNFDFYVLFYIYV